MKSSEPHKEDSHEISCIMRFFLKHIMHLDKQRYSKAARKSWAINIWGRAQDDAVRTPDFGQGKLTSTSEHVGVDTHRKRNQSRRQIERIHFWPALQKKSASLNACTAQSAAAGAQQKNKNHQTPRAIKDEENNLQSVQKANKKAKFECSVWQEQERQVWVLHSRCDPKQTGWALAATVIDKSERAPTKHFHLRHSELASAGQQIVGAARRQRVRIAEFGVGLEVGIGSWGDIQIVVAAKDTKRGPSIRAAVHSVLRLLQSERLRWQIAAVAKSEQKTARCRRVIAGAGPTHRGVPTEHSALRGLYKSESWAFAVAEAVEIRWREAVATAAVQELELNLILFAFTQEAMQLRGFWFRQDLWVLDVHCAATES
jgi:hypothetical protein